MVYINTTGKHNEVWLDKPYATITVECPDCPSTEDAYNSGWTDGSEDGYHKGYQSGRTDGYDDGWGPGYESGYTDGQNACSGETCEGVFESGYSAGVEYQRSRLGAGTFTQNATYLSPTAGWSSVTVNVQPNLKKWLDEEITENGSYSYSPYPEYQGYGAAKITVNVPDRYNEGYNSGFTDGVNSVECSGYTQEDLDAAFQSGITYQKSLLTSTAITENGRYTSQNGFDDVTVSIDCQYGGYNTLDFTYVTTGDNQTINLFMGEMQNDNQYFYAFYSAITYMEIDGVPTLKDPNDIQRSTPEIPGENSYRLYTHTFASAGNHTVRFMMSRSFSASTQTGTKYPAFELTDLIFCSNSQDKCPVINANIGAGYEVLKTGVFQGNKTLTAATIPASVTGITWVTFENSTIKQLTCYGTTPPTLGSNVFAGVTTLEHIYVPAEAVEDYKAATNWSNYASIISAIQ